MGTCQQGNPLGQDDKVESFGVEICPHVQDEILWNASQRVSKQTSRLKSSNKDQKCTFGLLVEVRTFTDMFVADGIIILSIMSADARSPYPSLHVISGQPQCAFTNSLTRLAPVPTLLPVVDASSDRKSTVNSKIAT